MKLTASFGSLEQNLIELKYVVSFDMDGETTTEMGCVADLVLSTDAVWDHDQDCRCLFCFFLQEKQKFYIFAFESVTSFL